MELYDSKKTLKDWKFQGESSDSVEMRQKNDYIFYLVSKDNIEIAHALNMPTKSLNI